MIRSLVLTVALISPFQSFALSPEVLECTVAFAVKPGANEIISVVKDSVKNVRWIHSAEVPGNRQMHLIRFTGNSVSDFAGAIRFESAEGAQFQIIANSGRSFGDVQLFDLEVNFQENKKASLQSAKAEMVSKSSPPELNSYASLKGHLGFHDSALTDYEINCGTVGWNFGGL